MLGFAKSGGGTALGSGFLLNQSNIGANRCPLLPAAHYGAAGNGVKARERTEKNWVRSKVAVRLLVDHFFKFLHPVPTKSPLPNHLDFPSLESLTRPMGFFSPAPAQNESASGPLNTISAGIVIGWCVLIAGIRQMPLVVAGLLTLRALPALGILLLLSASPPACSSSSAASR